MSLRFLLEELGRGGATVHQLVDACLEEDHDHIQRANPTDRTSYRRSRVAQGRFMQHRQTYKMAMKMWQRSPQAKSFYRRLARWNKTHWDLMSRFKQRSKGLPGQESVRPADGQALLEFFGLVVAEFAGRQDQLSELAEFSGYLVDELGALVESAAWQIHYQHMPYYYDWYGGFAELVLEDG